MGSVDGEEAMRGPSGRDNERIMVSVRVRPLNDKEADRDEVVDWECISDTTIVYKNYLSPERSVYPSSYTFDRVFRCNCSTRQVYEEGAKSVVLSAVSGINSSVFAYGQTSSGKTFTMSGITEYTMVDIFDYIEKHKERDFHLKFSALEIYNESVRDLLTADNSPLRLLDDPERGTVVEKLTEETLRDWNHFQELLAVCEAQRQIGETFLNEASSRSHQILRLTIESSTREYLGKNNSSSLAATLNFVDLAGSERASQALSAGSRLKEGSHINRSLLTLGTVIRKLSKGGTGHIPFRDSKLTRILQSSLGGNARTAVICTMSPARSYVEQSRNTLLFASCAKEVTTNARVNVVMSDKALVKHLQRELTRLESELNSASPSIGADATDLLRDKELKIEELERQVKELTLQLELAFTQIQDLQQSVEDRSPSIWEGEESSYPKLFVRQASEHSSLDELSVADDQSFSPHSQEIETPHSPDRHSRFSYDENNSISDFDENHSPSSPFERVFIKTPSDASSHVLVRTTNVTGNDRHQVPYAFSEQKTDLSEVDPYTLSDGIGGQTPNSFQSDAHDVSVEVGEQNVDDLESHLEQVHDNHAAQSPYFVEFDPYQVSDESSEHAPDSSDVHQFEVSDRDTEKALNNDHIETHQTLDQNREQTENQSEDYCKEVQCIESGYVQDNSLAPEEERQSLMSHKSNMYTFDESKQEMNPSSLPESKEGEQLIDEIPVQLKNMNSVVRKGSQSVDMSSTSPSYGENVKYEMQNKSQDGGDEFVVRLEDIRRKLSAMKYSADDEIPEISMADIIVDESPVIDIKVSTHMDETENCTSTTKKKKITKSLSVDQIPMPDIKVEDTPQKANTSIKNMRDVGLNPQDDLDATSALLLDSKGLQREIIGLWDACNTSLVYRTYFFLLYIMGDPEDTVYLEVERRRLCCIKDAFSRGNSIDVDGRKITPGSSRRSLHSERNMLAKQMKRRLSSQERRSIYTQWGINLRDKRRSFQVAHLLWVDTIDMDHIMESANIVAKLVKFSAPQVPKEVFGLNFRHGRRKSFSWRAETAFS